MNAPFENWDHYNPVVSHSNLLLQVLLLRTECEARTIDGSGGHTVTSLKN